MATINEKMTAIADAIRARTGKTDPLTLDGMAEEIAAIPSGGGGVPTCTLRFKSALTNSFGVTGSWCVAKYDGEKYVNDWLNKGGSLNIQEWDETFENVVCGSFFVTVLYSDLAQYELSGCVLVGKMYAEVWVFQITAGPGETASITVTG